MKKVKAFFNNPKVMHLVLKILVLAFIIFLIFVKFAPLIFVNDDNSSDSMSLISPFSLPLYYNIDTFLLSFLFVGYFSNLFIKNKVISKLNFVISLLAFFTYFISFLFVRTISGLFILFVALYMVEVILVYCSINLVK